MNQPQRDKSITHAQYSWSGSLFLWSDQSLYIGSASDSTIHSTHDVTVGVAMHGTFRLGTSKGWRTFQAAIIPPDLPHIFDGRGARLALVYFPAEILKSQRRTYLGNEPLSLSPAIVSRFLPCLRIYLDQGNNSEEATGFCEDFIRELSGMNRTECKLDSRVMQALEYFRTDPTLPHTLAEISSRVALSPSRFAHLFSEEVGLHMRRYLLELRMRRAMLQVANGHSLTTSAYDAGFSDSAHLSRTFRRMTGISPSSLLRYSTIIPSKK